MAFDKARALQEAGRSVIQGKISQAIKQYFDIYEKDPSDVILLNTIGDLYIRDKNVSEGLKQFYRLAEAYVEQGFTVKAIAIYKKIVKLEPNSADSFQKLAELYQIQRLAREAREQYYQVAEFYKKKNQNDKVLEALRKAVQLDVENTAARDRLAKFCEEMGRKDEARQVYLETAQMASRRGDAAAAQVALKKAQVLDPHNHQVYLLRAREALANKHPEEVERILSAIPGLKDDPAGQALLMESYLSTQQLMKVEKLVLDRFHANPGDFSPVASFVSVCVRVHEFDTAFKVLSGLTDELIEQRNTGSLMSSLRLVWDNSPAHLPTLELIYRICVETGDEPALPEILEALGHAYVKCEQLDKAEQAFRRLVSREPENEQHKALLKQLLQKQGNEVGRAHDADLSAPAMAHIPEEGTAAPAVAVARDPKREAMVKEGLENSDLFVRYQLLEKAVAELDKVLEIYPDEIEIHKRLVEMCRKDMPERAKQEAQTLVRICTQLGDAAGAGRYTQLAGGQEAPVAQAVPPQAVPAPAVSPESLPPLPAQPAAGVPGKIGLASESSLAPIQEAETAPTRLVSATASAESAFDFSPPPEQEAPARAPAEIPFDVLASPAGESPTTSVAETPLDLSIAPVPEAPSPTPVESPFDLWGPTSSAPSPAPPSEIQEVDLSGDWEFIQAQAASSSPPPAAPQEEFSLNYEDNLIEINFYLQNDFVDEARTAVEELERKLPDDPRTAELRALVEGRAGALLAEVPEKQPAEVLKPIPSGPVVRPPQKPFSAKAGEPTLPGPVVPPPQQPVSAKAGEPTLPGPVVSPLQELVEEWELPGICAAPEPEARPAALPPSSPGEEEIPTEAPIGANMEATASLLGELAEAFGSAMEGLAEPSPPPVPPSAPTAEPATISTAPAPEPASLLGGLLEEMGEAPSVGPAQQDDPQTHFNLGVAFREMNLLDEAIGEFQKAVKGAGKGYYPPNYLPACSLLALCFMNKGMAAVAVKWYQRALETPDLDEEAILALRYDLGVAYQQAGDVRSALEKFIEVYGENIDFRDVAEKVRILQQKV